MKAAAGLTSDSKVLKLCNFASWGFRVSVVLFLATYVANMVVVFDHPDAVIVGWSEHKEWHDANGLTQKSFSSLGITRFAIRPSGPDNSGVLVLSGAQIPLANMTRACWEIYILYISVFATVVTLLLLLLASLFRGFAAGEFFTWSSIRRIRWIGYTLIAEAIVEFGTPYAALGIYRAAAQKVSLGVSSISFEFPLNIVATGVLITIVALVFDEGRKMQEDAALTV